MSTREIFQRLKVDPSKKGYGGTFQCPLCSGHTLLHIGQTPYVKCSTCKVPLDPVQLWARSMGISEYQAEKDFRAGLMKEVFDISVYESKFFKSRSEFLSCQQNALSFMEICVADLRYNRHSVESYMGTSYAGSSGRELPVGIGGIPPADCRPAFTRGWGLPNSGTMIPYTMHGIVTHLCFTDQASGKEVTRTVIDSRHGIFPDVSETIGDTAYVAMTAKAAIAFHIKACAKTNNPLPLFHQKDQVVPIPSVRNTILVDCFEGRLDIQTACKYLELLSDSNRIEVSTLRCPVVQVKAIDLMTVLNKKTGLVTWIAMQMNKMYSEGKGAEVCDAIQSAQLASTKKQLVIDRIKELNSFSSELVEMLEQAVHSGPSVVINGRTIVVKGKSMHIVHPENSIIVDVGIYVNAGIQGGGYYGYDVTILTEGANPLNLRLSLNDLKNETVLSQKILQGFMSLQGVSKMPVFVKYPGISWASIIPKLAESKPVFSLVDRLGYSNDHIYFPNCGYNLLTNQMGASERGLVYDLPEQVSGRYSQIMEPREDMSKEAEQLFASTNPHDIGFTIIISHMLYNLVQSAVRASFAPSHLMVTGREHEFWEPITSILHGGLHYNRKIPALPASVAEMDRFMKAYHRLGSLPLPCRTTDGSSRELSYLLDNVDFPLIIFGPEILAAKLSGLNRLTYLARPNHIRESDKSIILSCNKVPELISWLVKLALSSRDELTRCYSSAPATTMRNHICHKLGVPESTYASRFNVQTFSLMLYNSSEDMFAELGKIMDSPTSTTVKAALAYQNALENLPDNYIGFVENQYIHLHKDRVVRILNSKERRFNKGTLESDLTLKNLRCLNCDTVSFSTDYWSIPRLVWDLRVSPVCPQDTELQIQEMLAVTLEENSISEGLWTTHSHSCPISTPKEYKPRPSE